MDISNDGNEALNKYKDAMRSKRPFDIVILDLTVKYGMGGKETMDKLKKIDPDVRAIISSGYTADPVLAAFQEYGFKNVLVKPYNSQDLDRVLHEVLGDKNEDASSQ